MAKSFTELSESGEVEMVLTKKCLINVSLVRICPSNETCFKDNTSYAYSHILKHHLFHSNAGHEDMCLSTHWGKLSFDSHILHTGDTVIQIRQIIRKIPEF